MSLCIQVLTRFSKSADFVSSITNYSLFQLYFSVNDADDHILIRRCLKGDKNAFGDIVDRYQKQVYNAVLRIVREPNDAEDVTQAVFIKVFENLSSFKFDRRFFSWLYRIALNEAINARRQRERFTKFDENDVWNENTPEQLCINGDLERSVDEAVYALKLEYRVPVVLYHFHHLSYSEISYILDISEKKVKSRLFTARTYLRKILLKKEIALQ
jgi:RNA polymerase sigma-70 factor (ECF subfamily)